MKVGGFTESIWHFMGYLHLADALARQEILLDGKPQILIKLEFTVGVPVDARRLDDGEDLSARPVRFDQFEHVETDFIARQPEVEDVAAALARFSSPAAAAPILRSAASSSAAETIIILPRQIDVRYEQDAQQTLASITQVNLMMDRDIVTDGALFVKTAHGWAENFDALDTWPLLGELFDQALGEVPEDLMLPADADTADIAAFVAARDAGRASDDAVPDQQVAPGRYVDGVLTDAPVGEAAEAPSLEGPSSAEMVSDGLSITRTLTGPSDGVGTAALTGGNEAINAAVIRDLSGLHGSTIVGGDVFFSNAIVQVNVLVDNDDATLAIGWGIDPLLGDLARSCTADGNALHNVAEFVTHEFSAVLRGAAFTPMWTVDVVEGDFFCVRALSQINVLSDDDCITQTSFDTWYKLGTGDNQQVNLADVYGFDQYDVIIIGGNAHHANWIFQKNILFDSDLTLSLVNGESGSQTVFAGGNSLTNDARIITYGAADHGELTDAQRELMAALDRGDTSLLANPAWQMGGSASGTLKVLYVTGDYYDVNVISQTNIMSDADQVAQWAASQGGVSQGAVTGANDLLNEARILDAGTLSGSAFAGGDVYHESILIQANIVTDQNTITIHDDAAYVSELIAFTGPDQPDGCSDSPAPVRLIDPGHYDSAGNVLT